MRVIRVILLIVVVLVVCISSFAKLMGEGEVTGEVIDSWLSGDRVVFRLNISGQKNERGPKLASPNTFAYAGPDKMEITKGDIISLHYNSDDSYGIHVERVEFIENKPGTVVQGNSTLWVILLIAALAAGGLIIFMRRRGLR